MAVRQRDIAEELSVSLMTVSRALRGDSGTSEGTRRRVLEAARKMGLPLPASRKLARNGDLWHVLCATGIGDASAEMLSGGDWIFHARIHDGLCRGAFECGGEMIFCGESVYALSWPTVVARSQVDGTVLVCGNEREFVVRAPCPVPLVYIFNGPPRADVVTVNNFRGGVQLGKLLAARGHRRVAFIGPETEMARERLYGLRSGIESAGGVCPPDLARLKPSAGGQERENVEDLLGGETRPEVIRQRFTAIACYNDWFAVHAIARLRERGLRVPYDLSVTGFDNVMPRGYDGPKLTTCALPLEELGAEAARMVYWRIEHPNAIRRTLTLEADMVEGESVGEVKTEN